MKFKTHVSFQFLEECDDVLYLKNGKISERGTHLELAALGGDYSHMLSYDQERDKKKDKKKAEEEVPTDLEEEPPIGA